MVWSAVFQLKNGSASKLATDLMEKYSMYELIVLGDSVPLKIEV